MKYHRRGWIIILVPALLASICVIDLSHDTNAQATQRSRISIQNVDIGSSRADAGFLPPPSNDNFLNFTSISGPCCVVNGTNVEATKEPGEPNHAGNPGGKSVWFRWTAPPSSISITFSTGNTNTNFDTLLAVYTGASVSALTTIGSNDDYRGELQSSVTFATTPNGVYFIAVDGFDGASGPLQLDFNTSFLNVHSTDFDGSGLGDVTVFRPSNGTWYSKLTQGGNLFQGWGQNGDVPVPADYDGDFKTDFAVWRPSTGVWYILRSRSFTLQTRFWGTNGDKPVPGDYFADGRADFAVFRPSNGTWYVSNQVNGVTIFQAFGQNGDKPAALDYDGDGRHDFAVFRPSNGTWYILNSHDNSFTFQQWGQNGDIPVPGDYGLGRDGKADIAVFRPSNGTWYVLRSHTNTLLFAVFGTNGDIPQPARFDLLSAWTTFAVFRPSNSTFYIVEAFSGNLQTVPWGAPGDIPATSPYIIQP